MQRITTYLLIALAVACAVLWGINRKLSEDNTRLSDNFSALKEQAEVYRTESGKSAASVQRLQLTNDELKAHYAEVCKVAEDLNIKVKRLQSASTHATQTIIEAHTIVKDSIVYRDATPDTLRVIEWSDPWVDIDGVIEGQDLALNVTSTDTLTQIVHRVPKKFWFIRYGTKAIRQEIVSSNPHTKIVYSEYIELKK